jgi:hypothetical protein
MNVLRRSFGFKSMLFLVVAALLIALLGAVAPATSHTVQAGDTVQAAGENVWKPFVWEVNGIYYAVVYNTGLGAIAIVGNRGGYSTHAQASSVAKKVADALNQGGFADPCWQNPAECY